MEVSRKELEDALLSRCTEEMVLRLSKARVSVAGLGGLGSHVAVELARAGVGHLHLVDFDRVDVTNLNRQHYFIRHLGRYKTDALKEQLLEINPWLDIRTDCTEVTAENIPDLFGEADVICEAFDRPENKAMLVNRCLELFPEKNLICASGMAGWGDSNGIRTKQISARFYLCGDETSEVADGSGLMAPRVALCAAHEANLAVELILGAQKKQTSKGKV